MESDEHDDGLVLSCDSRLASKASAQSSSLALEAVLFSGGDRGDFDDSRTETVVTGLRGEVGTGTTAVSCISLVWGERTRIPRR